MPNRRHSTCIRLPASVLSLLVALAIVPALPPIAGALEVPMPVPVAKPQLDADGKVVIVPTLKNALAALDDGDLETALNIHAAMAEDAFDRRVLSFSLALSSDRRIDLETLSALREDFADWPEEERIAANFERALYRGNPDAATTLAYFGERQPETLAGRIALLRALRKAGRSKQAEAGVRALWADIDLDPATATVFNREFSDYLQPSDHLRRMQRLLYRDRISAALAPARLAGAESLYQAWVQTIRSPKRAEAAIDKVDAAFADDPALLYLRIRRLRQMDDIEAAAALLETMPEDDEALVDPEEWWVEQRIVGRTLWEAGDPERAYRVFAAHRASEPKIAAEAEFHAGWVALSGLNDPDKALVHFNRLSAIATTPATRARAAYWTARSLEAAPAETGDETKSKARHSLAQEHYAQAAKHPGSYYGQLATAALGIDTLDLPEPDVSAADEAQFSARPAVRALKRLQELGFEERARRLYRSLAQTLEDPAEIAQLVGLAQQRDDHRLCLQIGKIAYNRGLDVAPLAFPLGALPADADTAGAGRALAYSVARQESAFNVAAVSPANARGLLQLLPGTARAVAGRNGLAYSPNRLVSDAAYNATLGTLYLDEQIDRFDGSYILTFIAYNAGPRRVGEWIERFGDPRGMPLADIIDWVEKIPYPETRNYVQHVLENYQVYKARLGQPANLAEDLRFGRRG
ncbi:lytic transglycosylase domain-containing protein [Pseudohoeflea coraliihabitans]|uniref:Lytic transglycosylase domain-containing protein n=1 Tax=Pseudohoeflea coraliihabitans TaxID=2860393 RepID=A0ABS6WPD7_9HYPH|nr:lytic transglycosylase domain-containing protein [Pseudohoeflea sp. DP4N28-3]MBW3097831.1 lytic transglycosylase domain-containing protein [Pseudohoeflea sp. DP4N28-3]